MDRTVKTALIIIGALLAGMLLLGTAFALPLAFHSFGRGFVTTTFGPQGMGRPGMMGEQGFREGGRGPGMMGRGDARGDGRGICPNGAPGEGRRDGRTCPNCPNSAEPTQTATES